MTDSLEDRIHRAGKHKQFSAAVNKFRKSRKSRSTELDLYDTLVQLGASSEEADEFVNLEVECGE